MNFLILIFLWVIVPVLLGEHIAKEKNKNIIYVYCLGFFLELTLFHYLYLVFLGLNQPFHRLCNAYILALVIISLFLLVKRRHQLKGLIYTSLRNIRKWPWYVIIAIVLIFFQCYFKITTMTRMALDDSEYLVCAVDAVYCDKMWYINPYTGNPGWTDFTIIAKRWTTSWIMYYAFVGKTTGIHVATVAHTILPIIVIFVAYMIYTLIGMTFFEGDRKKVTVFLIILNVLLINGWSNRDNAARSLLIFSWHGRTILYALGIPFLGYYIIEMMKKKFVTWNDTLICFFIVTVMVSATTMSLPILCIILPMANLMYWKRYRKPMFSIPKATITVLPMLISVLIYMYGRFLWNPF